MCPADVRVPAGQRKENRKKRRGKGKRPLLGFGANVTRDELIPTAQITFFPFLGGAGGGGVGVGGGPIVLTQVVRERRRAVPTLKSYESSKLPPKVERPASNLLRLLRFFRPLSFEKPPEVGNFPRDEEFSLYALVITVKLRNSNETPKDVRFTFQPLRQKFSSKPAENFPDPRLDGWRNSTSGTTRDGTSGNQEVTLTIGTISLVVSESLVGSTIHDRIPNGGKKKKKSHWQHVKVGGV